MRYEIQGETLPVVICYLDGGEKMITEGGGMSWMSPNMKMETTTNGGIGKAFGRMFSGEQWDDRICIFFPGIDQSVRNRTGTGDGISEECIPCK